MVMGFTALEAVGSLFFAFAVLHTFSGRYFENLSKKYPAHSKLLHLLGEVEVSFGLWAMFFMLVMFGALGHAPGLKYLSELDFTEPMFIFAVMIVAASQPILQVARGLVDALSKALPVNGQIAYFFVVMSMVPLLGSLITEPAAMTLAALLLRDRFFKARDGQSISQALKYATLGTLFVNVSIGGTLTPFAAPPVLMVAGKWGWDLSFMLTNFGWKAAIAVMLNACLLSWLFRRELGNLATGVGGLKERTDLNNAAIASPQIPILMTLLHLFVLFLIVFFAHDPVVFMALLIIFLGLAATYPQYQSRLLVREGLLVGLFLAGLVVLGGQQKWWLQPLMRGMSVDAIFYGAILLTALTDNAALTYLGSLVEGLSPEFKYALVAGAVTGGGLTVIANAPNPAGYSILKSYFDREEIKPLHLLLAALPGTLIALAAFRWL